MPKFGPDLKFAELDMRRGTPGYMLAVRWHEIEHLYIERRWDAPRHTINTFLNRIEDALRDCPLPFAREHNPWDHTAKDKL